MAEHVKVRRPVRRFWQAGVDAARVPLSGLKRVLRRLFPAAPASEGEWDEWFSEQDWHSDFPIAGISQTEEDVVITVQTPGYEARDLEVTVMDDRVTVDGVAETFRQNQDGPVFFAELGERRMMRQFELPVRILPETLRANWEDGMLWIAARKQVVEQQEEVALAA
ncbi:MAG: Hsp20/alpha crystallin family protein [Bryobacteraceae bacterium]|nr:Hsp20/alpha crystallin family protein [Bryobacteraceae bacterium]